MSVPDRSSLTNIPSTIPYNSGFDQSQTAKSMPVFGNLFATNFSIVRSHVIRSFEESVLCRSKSILNDDGMKVMYLYVFVVDLRRLFARCRRYAVVVFFWFFGFFGCWYS